MHTGDTSDVRNASLYAQYIQERDNKHIVEDERGFATYFCINDGIYIEDIFVDKEHRHLGIAASYADKIANIARESGYKKLYGSVVPAKSSSTTSLKVLLAYGFSLSHCDQNIIYMVKEL